MITKMPMNGKSDMIMSLVPPAAWAYAGVMNIGSPLGNSGVKSAV